MASRAAILRAARAGAPGAAQPTYPPQGGSPWIGALPSYAMEPGSGYSRVYGPFLPRPQETFTQGAFGPFAPIIPVPVDQPGPGLPRAQPRRWQPYVGYNLPIGQPGTEGYKLASFATLKTLSETYSILRTCIERRKNEIRALEWEVVLTPEAAKAYQGDAGKMRDFLARRDIAKKFFRRPDQNYYTFEAFIHAMMDQVFTIDALSLYQCPKKGRGMGRGLFGSDLDNIWLIDGSSIRPLMGLHGEVPLPPAPGFQQYEFGVPRADLTTMLAGLDLDGEEGELVSVLRGDQFIYHPYLQRVDSPYGFSLVEQALIPIMTGLRKQAYQLDYFAENTTPRVYISPGDTTLTPNQIREMQDALNAVAGDLSWSFKVQVIPPGSKVMPVKEMEIVDQADEWIATEVAMVCDISPMELGILPKISTVASPFAAREMAQANRAIRERTATKPTLSYVQSVFNFILQDVCGQHDLQFVFEGMQEVQDQAAMTDMLVKQVQSGLRAIDEARDQLHLTPWDLPETREPVVFTQMGPVPLDEAVQQSLSQIRQAITGSTDDPRAQAAVESLSRQASASGQSKRKALPAGTSGQGRLNGAVTQRQARRGGALAPANATAEGSPGHSGSKNPSKAAKASGSCACCAGRGEHPTGHECYRCDASGRAQGAEKTAPFCDEVFRDETLHAKGCPHCGKHPLGGVAWSSSKAATAELEALERHLRKGMPVSEWVPVALPGVVMAMIAQDLESGFTPAYACKSASAMLPKAPATSQEQQAAQRRRQQQLAAQQARQRQLQAQLAAQYAAQVQAAINAALTAAARLVAAWIAGTLAVTAATLAWMILEEFRRTLSLALTALWTAAWQAAVQAAAEDTGTSAPVNMEEALEAFLATWGENWVSVISSTGEADIVQAIKDALALGDPASVVGALGKILDPAGRAEQIATSEVTRAWAAAYLLVMKAAGIAYKTWITRNDAKVCAKCRRNQAAGAIPVDSPFPSGDRAPPGHPRCRCRPGIGFPPADVLTGKVLRREIGLNGQETWQEWEPQPDVSGGRVFQPHRADGTQVPQGGVPGASAGGEPPRWDGTEVNPRTEFVPDPDYGEDAGIGPSTGTGVPPGAYWPATYMDGWWPSPAGHGAGQPAPSAPGAPDGPSGRPPNPVGKQRAPRDAAVRFLRGAPHAKPGAVYQVMLKNFPPEALAWVKRIRWAGPVDMPIELLETSGRDKWAASHEHAHVDDLARQMEDGGDVNPIIAVVRAGHNHARMIDGRHRTLASEKLGRPVTAYVGFLDNANETAAYDTYHHQVHEGDDPRNKSFTAGNTGQAGAVHGLVPFNLLGAPEKVSKDSVGYGPATDLSVSCGTCSMFIAGGTCTDVEGPIKPEDHCRLWKPRVPAAVKAARCAGVAVRAADTGRVLMIQRAITGDDPAGGLFEFPGGHLEDGELPLEAALREFAEEVGHPAPGGEVTGRVESPNGIFETFILTIPREQALDLTRARQVTNPDGDFHEPAVWWDPVLAEGNPAVRQEIRQDWHLLAPHLAANASKSAETPMLEATPHQLGPHGLWHTPDRHVPEKQKLPNYIEHIAAALMRDQGMGEQQAIATAINAVKRWARGDLHWGHGKVTPEVQAASARAVAEWQQLRASHAG